jgi:hypothetical protein
MQCSEAAVWSFKAERSGATALACHDHRNIVYDDFVLAQPAGESIDTAYRETRVETTPAVQVSAAKRAVVTINAPKKG